MTDNEDTMIRESGFVDSKFGKVFLTIMSVFLIFGGPTYVIYGLANVLNVNLVASFAVGFVLFIIGLLLMRFLIQKKVIS